MRPAIIEYLPPQLTHLRKVSIEGGKITGEREDDEGVQFLEATRPQISGTRRSTSRASRPSKAFMAAKKKQLLC